MNVEQLCGLYVKSRKLTLRPQFAFHERAENRRITTEKNYIRNYIVPALGAVQVEDVNKSSVETLDNFVSRNRRDSLTFKFNKSEGFEITSQTSYRCALVLRDIFEYAKRKSQIASNPIERFTCPKRMDVDVISDRQYAALGTGLAKADKTRLWPNAVAAIRFMAVAGWSKGEVLRLKWDDIDFSNATAVVIHASRGRTERPLASLALQIIDYQKTESPYVFSAARSTRPIDSLAFYWNKTLRLGDLGPGVTPVCLRNRFLDILDDFSCGPDQKNVIAGYNGRAAQMLKDRHIYDSIIEICNKSADIVWSKLHGFQKCSNIDAIPFHKETLSL